MSTEPQKKGRRYTPATHPKAWQVPRSRDDFIRAARMDGAGQSHRAIGAAFGVSRQRASVMVAKGRDLMRGEQLELPQ